MEFQMTIQTKVEHLTAKQASIFATLLVYEGLSQGVDMVDYMLLEFLYSFLSRNREVLQITMEKHRQSALLLEAFLQMIRGNWVTIGTKEQIPDDMFENFCTIAGDWLPNARTVASWKTYWVPDKFFSVRIVPLELIIDRSGYSERYSSYCKGYGDGGHVSRTKKTPYDYELDGEDTDRNPPSFNLLDLERYQSLLIAIEREKAKRMQGRI